MRRMGFALAVLMFTHAASVAHYNMLLPDKPWAEQGEKVAFTYQFGHPFEHELFDAPPPRMVLVIQPDGQTRKIDRITKVALAGADGKKVAGFTFAYEPGMRGDHTFLLQTPPIWMEESREYVQDTVKVVLHVQAQKNWDADLKTELFLPTKLKMIPLTRPYGLLPGMIFQARVGHMGSPPKSFPDAGLVHWFTEGGRLIEVERYNAQPVKNPPADELITFKTKTDPLGIVTFAFPQPGWWGMTAAWQEPNRKWLESGKEAPLRERTTLWIHVDEKK